MWCSNNLIALTFVSVLINIPEQQYSNVLYAWFGFRFVKGVGYFTIDVLVYNTQRPYHGVYIHVMSCGALSTSWGLQHS
jgi:hypothetical protein